MGPPDSSFLNLSGPRNNQEAKELLGEKEKQLLSRSAQVIAFLKSQGLEDEQPFVAKKTRSSAMKKSATRNKSNKKTS